MKTFAFALVTALSLNASAITFITEEEVQETLQAQKVIELNPYLVQEKLVATGSDCEEALSSRSSRAYVVKKDQKSLLFVTTHDLANLQECGEL